MDSVALTASGWGIAVVLLLVLLFRSELKGQADTAAVTMELYASNAERQRLESEIAALRKSTEDDRNTAAYARYALQMYDAGAFSAADILHMLKQSLHPEPAPPGTPRITL